MSYLAGLVVLEEHLNRKVLAEFWTRISLSTEGTRPGRRVALLRLDP